MKKPPTKLESFVEALVHCESLNTFEANKHYGDTCLHSTVSEFQKRFSIKVERETERVRNRYDKEVSVTRYKVRDIEEMKCILAKMRKARGI